MTNGEAVTYQLCPNAIVWRLEAPGVLVYDISRDRVFNGNRTAQMILEGCESETPITEIAAQLSRRFQIPVARADTDVCRFMQQLARFNLVQPVERSHGAAECPGQGQY